MKCIISFLSLLILVIIACHCSTALAQKPSSVSRSVTLPDTFTLFDKTRSRPIPVAVYHRKKLNGPKRQPVVMLSHGYGQNHGGDYLQYSYIAEHLATKGFYVISIQHELPTDSLMPMEGIPQVVRKPFWERGVVNILFVLNRFKVMHPELDYTNVNLIGHSNGGDMSMLFAGRYPQLLARVISLDNRRVALPRTFKPKVYSLRSSDQPADADVLPDSEEQKRYGIRIINLPATIHNDMDDDATPAQRAEINGYLDQFMGIAPVPKPRPQSRVE